jgi:A/G-specific adenine glycosylase
MAAQKQQTTFFEKTIGDFWQKAGRHDLPWRKKTVTPYEVWVSEVMLQQTQVSRVVGYYTRFIKKFPTVEVLAKATWEEFLPYYEGLGYYNRGRNMLLCAKKVATEYRGVFPKDTKELQTLPGVGPYTASAIASFGYNQRALAWDTNLRRVVGRFFFGSKKANIDEECFAKLFTTPRKKLNAALMDFGSAVCTAKPKCTHCPLQTKCQYKKESGKQEAESVKQKDHFPATHAQAVVFLHQNHQEYFSRNKKKYQPFILPAAYNTRAGTKDWFQEQYNLSVSVRPPHAKVYQNKKPFLLVNAQILLGQHQFSVFSKTQVEAYNKKQQYTK